MGLCSRDLAYRCRNLTWLSVLETWLRPLVMVIMADLCTGELLSVTGETAAPGVAHLCPIDASSTRSTRMPLPSASVAPLLGLRRAGSTSRARRELS